MKKLILLISIVGFFNSNFFSQDIIFTKSQTEIKAKVLEITPDAIKYKEYDFLDGPTRNIVKSDVFMIQFANGKKEFISDKKKDVNQQINRNKKEKELETNEFPINRISLSPGLGMSYCFAGIRTQFRRSGKIDFGLDLTFGRERGLFGDNEITSTSGPQFGLGLKWYFFKDLYINTSYSYLGKYEVLTDKSRYFTSLLIGMDIMKYSKNIGYGLNIGFGMARIGNVKRLGYDSATGLQIYSNKLDFDTQVGIDLGIVFAFGVSN